MVTCARRVAEGECRRRRREDRFLQEGGERGWSGIKDNTARRGERKKKKKQQEKKQQEFYAHRPLDIYTHYSFFIFYI